MTELNTEDIESLAGKIASLELTDGERRALGALVAAAGADSDVEGFVWNPRTGATSERPRVVSPHLAAPLLGRRIAAETGLLTDDGTLVL